MSYSQQLKTYISEIIASQTRLSPKRELSSQHSGERVAKSDDIHFLFHDNYVIIRETLREHRNQTSDLWNEFDAFDLFELKKEVKQLSSWKIVRPLGCGVYKCAFLMSNDHVLSFGTHYQDASVYEKLMIDTYSGRATRKDIGIFDFKKLTREMFYVEMSRIVTLYDWMTFTRKMQPRTRGEHQLELIVSLINETVMSLIRRARDEDRQQSEVIDVIDKNIFKLLNHEKTRLYYTKISSVTEILTPKEIKELAKTLAHVAMTHGLKAIYDMHSKNIGVDMQDPSKFIPFDVD